MRIVYIGAAHYNPNVAIRGEIGASFMRKWVINDRLNYINGIQRNRNDLLELIRKAICIWKYHKMLYYGYTD